MVLIKTVISSLDIIQKCFLHSWKNSINEIMLVLYKISLTWAIFNQILFSDTSEHTIFWYAPLNLIN